MKLDDAYEHCVSITKKRAHNFYYAFLTLEKVKRRSICALYAYARELDDIADGDLPIHEKAAALDKMDQSLDASVRGEAPSLTFLALADTINRFDIPVSLLRDIQIGVMRDLTVHRYDTFEDLKQYCYYVASAVGLASLQIFGYTDAEKAKKAGIKMGIAMQLTNILRDISEDARGGRVYLPQEDLQRFDVHEDELIVGVPSPNLKKLIDYQIERARQYYAESTELFPLLPSRSRPCPAVMLGVYHEILMNIKDSGATCISDRVTIPKQRRALLALRLGLKGLLCKSPMSLS